MSYAALEDLRTLLPANITIGNVTTPSPISPKVDSISIAQANRFLYYAMQFIDSRLNAYYLTPLKRIIKERQPIIANMMPSSTVVKVKDARRFVPDGCVILSDTNGNEISSIIEVPETFEGECNINWLVLTAPTTNAYDSGSKAHIEWSVYPDPITYTAARLAVSFMFDKLFTADGSPDMSGYGKSLRNEAKIALDSILAGLIRLEGQEYTGRRFVRMQLLDSQKTTSDISVGQSKE